MTRFKLILFLLVCSLSAQGQNLLQAKYVRAIDSFRLKHIVDSISIDTAFSAASNRKLATAAAIKAYVDNRVGGGGAGTDLSFTGATSPVTLNSSTGTDVHFAEGSNVTLTQSGGTLTIAATGGSASPAGSDTQVQFNDGGAFGADTSLTWNKTTNVLTLGIDGGTGTLAFADSSTTTAYITVDGAPFLHTIDNVASTKQQANLFLGYDAGNTTLTGVRNTGIGQTVLASLTSGSNNFAFGPLCADALTTGSDNVSIGNNTLGAGQTTSRNIAIGSTAMSGCTGCDDNVVLGNGSMDASGAGDYNVAIGSPALGGNSFTGSGNVAIGSTALNALTSGTNNVAIGGRFTGLAMTTGARNVLLGYQCGDDITTNSNNVLIGYQSGNNGYNAASSVFVGYQSGQTETNGNRLYIESSNSATPLIGGHFDNDRVGINTTVANLAATLHVTGSGATSSTYSLIVTNSAAATATATLVVRDDLRVGIGTNAPAVSLDAGANTDGVELPTGTTAQRVANDNTIRSNTDVDGLEFRYNAHWNRLTSEATPSISAGAAAGTGPTISVGAGSNDLAGTIVLTTGTSATTGAICTVTFAQGLDSGLGTFVVLNPGNANTPAVQQYISSSGNTSFTISTVNALSDATDYVWHYHVRQ